MTSTVSPALTRSKYRLACWRSSRTPIRSTLRRIDRKEALEKLGLYPGIPTLLVMGGSQGASGINQALIKAMPSLQNIPLQVIHLSGSRDERLLEDNYRR